MLSQGDDRLGTPIIEGDTATYSYCAAREVNHAIAPCRRPALPKEKVQDLLLRVTMVAQVATRISYQLTFETIGPSCKFPVAADHSGDYEYTLLITNKMHMCYQLETTQEVKKVQSTSSPLQKFVDMFNAKQTNKDSQLDVWVKPKKYRVHIKITDPDDEEILPLLRAFGKGQSGDDWVTLQPLSLTKTEVTYSLAFPDALPDALGDVQFAAPKAQIDPNTGIETTIANMIKRMNSPTWFTVTVLSDESHNFKIWFVDEDKEEAGPEESVSADEKEDGSADSWLSFIVGFILVICVGCVCAVVCLFQSPDYTAKYSRVDGLSVGGADDDDDDSEAVGVSSMTSTLTPTLKPNNRDNDFEDVELESFNGDIHK